MILTYSNIILIAIIIIVLFFILYIYFDKSHLKWDNLKVEQLENFVRNNSILIDDFNFLTEKRKKCFYDNFTENVSYPDFRNILDIRLESKNFNDEDKIQYLNDNNDYQTFILKILKYISKCLNYSDIKVNSNNLRSKNKINTIDSKVVYMRLNDKITGTDKIKNEASEYIAKKLNDKGYTLNEFNYLDKFYIDPYINKSSAPIIKDFVNFLTTINKWAPKN